MLTLHDAEQAALNHQPRVIAAQRRAAAAGTQVAATRSAYLPTFSANVTGTVAGNRGTAIAAGALTTSSISDRFAYGGSVLQLVTDFGRTSALVQSAHYRHVAQEQQAAWTRAQVVWDVDDAYYAVLGAEAVLRAARGALTNRQLTAHQVSELAQSHLKSTLDVGFADVLASQAELAVVESQSTVERARAALGAAMGQEASVDRPLADDSVTPPLPPDADALVDAAMHQRADLHVAEAQRDAANAYADAQRRLRYPALSLMAAAGELPYHDATLHDNYAAAGFNLNLPLFDGGLMDARQAGAKYDAEAADQDARALRVEVAHAVRDAWLQASDAFKSLEVNARLVQQSSRALHLAEVRYQNGLGGIVELNEAQLNATSAEIGAAEARYSYLSRRANLAYTIGTALP